MENEIYRNLMVFLLPTMMALFENETNIEYKTQFHKPCEFKDILDMFKAIPPYFDAIDNLHPNQIELTSYYSMQLASTLLVNKKSLTMECLYNMLSLQSRLSSFVINILDYPERNKKLVGLLGLFMKEPLRPLRSNALLKILEYTDKYEKNSDKNQNVKLFKIFNIGFICLSVIGLLTNFILVLILKRSKYKRKKDSEKESETKLNNHFDLFSKRYQTCLILSLIISCQMVYLTINFIVLSQSKLTQFILSFLNTSQLVCKLSFFLLPPTTKCNILYQYSVWLLIYGLHKHGKKIRSVKYIEETIEYDTCKHESDEIKETMIVSDKKSIRTEIINAKNNFKLKNSCMSISVGVKNIIACIALFLLVVIYNSKNLILYSVNEISITDENKKKLNITFCAFSSSFSNYYILLCHEIFPILDLFLFELIPLIIGFHQLWIDLCLIILLKRERNKRFKYLKKYHIEWILYIFFILLFVSQIPFLFHQINDLVVHNVKFPFAFPIFISLIFSNNVILVLLETSLLCFIYSTNFFLFCIFDKDFRFILKFYTMKYFCCKTYYLNKSFVTYRKC